MALPDSSGRVAHSRILRAVEFAGVWPRFAKGAFFVRVCSVYVDTDMTIRITI